MGIGVVVGPDHLVEVVHDILFKVHHCESQIIMPSAP
jgi:hypothetical protein